jgi:hypothetical protein
MVWDGIHAVVAVAVAVGSVGFEAGKDLGSRGNNDAQRMFPSLRNNMTTRSRPGGVGPSQSKNPPPTKHLVDIQKRTDTAACMWRCGIAKAIDVLAHRLWVDPDLSQSLFEQPCVVHTLSSRKDFLSAHEKVVRVGKFLLPVENCQHPRENKTKQKDKRGFLGRAWCRRDGPPVDTCPRCKSPCCTFL